MNITIKHHNTNLLLNSLYNTRILGKGTPIAIPLSIAKEEIDIIKVHIQYIEEWWAVKFLNTKTYVNYDISHTSDTITTQGMCYALKDMWEDDCLPDSLLNEFRYCLHKQLKHDDEYKDVVRGKQCLSRDNFSSWLMTMIICAYMREVKLDVNFL